jgi:uncharacterized protein YbaR (Trm112 family)/ubiquinone/menaquinone biosynthesis C-methylase UbiE
MFSRRGAEGAEDEGTNDVGRGNTNLHLFTLIDVISEDQCRLVFLLVSSLQTQHCCVTFFTFARRIMRSSKSVCRSCETVAYWTKTKGGRFRGTPTYSRSLPKNAMLPSHYFEIICCPFCRGDLAGDESLTCGRCQKSFPVVDGIPVLLTANEDEVSRSIASFYENAWNRDDRGELKAKRIHEDMTQLGQRYITDAERRFDDVFNGQGSPKFFLDAACGAQPRTEYGKNFRYHVCVDFSLDGLSESRRILGDRAVSVCGSLLQLPLKDGAFDGVLASHCIYHIDKDRQATAIRELLRVLAPGGTMLILYANPDSSNAVSKAIKFVRNLRNRDRKPAAPSEGSIYMHLHSIDWMLETLSSQNGMQVSVRPLCAFTRAETESYFRRPLFGRFWFGLVNGLEWFWRNRPERSYYVAYVAHRK